MNCLEYEDVGSDTSIQDNVTKMVLSSVKMTMETLGKGTPLGWGQIVDVGEKHNHFGIGYHPSSRLSN